jgi:hypothetical protein
LTLVYLHGALLRFVADSDVLGDRVISGDVEDAYCDLDVILQERLRQLLHFFGPSGAKHERLAVGPDLSSFDSAMLWWLGPKGCYLFNNGPNLRLKTHVEHAIGFVHDEIRHASQVCVAAFEQIDQSTWCSDDNLGSAMKLANLTALGNTAIDASVPDF